MSLINQMLQELEQRKASASVQAYPELRQTAQPLQAVAMPRKRKLWQYVILAALCVSGAYVMQWLSHPAMPQAKPTVGQTSANGVISEAHAKPNSISELRHTTAAVSDSSDANPAAASQTMADARLFAPSLEKTLHLPHNNVATVAQASLASHSASAKAVVDQPPVMVATVAAHTPASEADSAEASVVALANAQPKTKPSQVQTVEPKVSVSKTMSAEQQAAHMYQQAIVYLQQGRVAEAQDQLKSAVEVYPAHDDARQTLVGLLVDHKRHDEAMQVLKAGLQHAPNHIGYTQALARLQLDVGMLAEALNTLERNSAATQQPQEYHALMAVVLQKMGRHDQAIAHYQQALSQGAAVPAWYIGLAVSLQAEGRVEEAKLAYQQAQASPLSPELALFVSQRLKQVQ